jgi:hypothetical protein
MPDFPTGSWSVLDVATEEERGQGIRTGGPPHRLRLWPGSGFWTTGRRSTPRGAEVGGGAKTAAGSPAACWVIRFGPLYEKPTFEEVASGRVPTWVCKHYGVSEDLSVYGSHLIMRASRSLDPEKANFLFARHPPRTLSMSDLAILRGSTTRKRPQHR